MRPSAWSLLALAACATSSPPVEPRGPADPTDAISVRPAKTPSGPTIEAEVGALDLAAVEAISDAIRGEVGRCFEEANAALDFPIVHGDIEVAIRVTSDGRTRHV